MESIYIVISLFIGLALFALREGMPANDEDK